MTLLVRIVLAIVAIVVITTIVSFAFFSGGNDDHPKIGHKLDSIEDDMFEKRAEDVVRDLSNVKQEIISYRKIIKPERSTLRLLERRVEQFLPEELDLYFDDIVDAAERVWDLLDNYKEVVEALESTLPAAARLSPARTPGRDDVESSALTPLAEDPLSHAEPATHPQGEAAVGGRSRPRTA